MGHRQIQQTEIKPQPGHQMENLHHLHLQKKLQLQRHINVISKRKRKKMCQIQSLQFPIFHQMPHEQKQQNYQQQYLQNHEQHSSKRKRQQQKIVVKQEEEEEEEGKEGKGEEGKCGEEGEEGEEEEERKKEEKVR